MSVRLLVDFYIALFGLVTGSYLNVVIHRVPRRISTVLPRSRCPRCLMPIRARDNIPVVSYLLLGGCCRFCGVRIHWRYPAIEAATAALFVASFERFGGTLEAMVAAGFSAAMLALAMIDLEHYILPDVITKTGLALGLALQLGLTFRPELQLSWTTPREAFLGAVLGGGFLWLLARLWLWWKGIDGMGMGDVKMLAMIGAFLGWQGVAVTLFVGSLSGSLVGGVQMLRGRMGLRSRLPFGPFLALGAVVALFFGQALFASYLGPLVADSVGGW